MDAPERFFGRDHLVKHFERLALDERGDRPHVVDGWSPESGVAIGLMFARDRLLTGVNEKNGAGEVQSRLVALRSGTNAWIQPLTFWQNGEERGHRNGSTPGSQQP